MALNWSSVKVEHVQAAFDVLKGRSNLTKRRGLVVRHQGFVLPAKDVLRVAYRLANALPEDVEIKFSSGDGTLNVLQRLGFEAERIDPAIQRG
jgi:hypothetical protein